MGTKARTYKATICDGHGCKSVVLAASSRDDAKNILKATLSPHQKVQEVHFQKWSTIQARPNDDDTGLEFVVSDEKEPLIFEHGHPSQPYLMKQFPRQVADVDEYIRRQREENS